MAKQRPSGRPFRQEVVVVQVSAIAFIPVLLVSAILQHENFILATADKPSAEQLKVLNALPVQEAVTKLKGEGYVDHVSGSRLYLIGPELMQETLYRNLPAFYASLSKLESGAFSVAGDEPLLKFVQAAFGDRYDNLEQAKFVVGGASQIDFSSGGRTIRVMRDSSLTPEERQAVEDAPVKQRAPDNPLRNRPQLDDFSPNPLDRVQLTVVGKPEYRQFTWGRDLKEVSSVLDARLKELHGAAVAALHGLWERLPASDLMREVSALEKGKAFSSMSSTLRDALGGEVTYNFKLYGFADQDEAERFLAGAQIDGVKKGFKLTGAKGQGSFTTIALFP